MNKANHYADIRDKRMSELTPEQRDRAHELWLRENYMSFGQHYSSYDGLFPSVLRVIDRLREQKPIDMILHCPNCGMQHIDEPEGEGDDEATIKRLDVWTNPPHRSHLCHGCGHIWRPADVPTNGVAEIKTRGKNDSPARNDGMPASAVERHLRRLLAYRVAMPGAYYDDGEAQGHEHGVFIDFMREPVEDIDAKLRALNVARAMVRPRTQPALPCDTHQTASGDHTVCKTCGETWRTGKANACLSAAEVLRKAAKSHG